MKFKRFKFKKVKSTNNTAIRIIKNLNCNYGMVVSDAQSIVEEVNTEKNGSLTKVICL